MPFILLFIAALSSFFGFKMAQNRGREPVLWAIICFFLGFVGLLILAAIGNRRVYQPETDGRDESFSVGLHTPIKYADKSIPVAPPLGKSKTEAAYDTKKWATLLEVDIDIANAASEIRPFGEIYEAELAEKYLALSNKEYLGTLVAKIKERAAQLPMPVSPAFLEKYQLDVQKNFGRDPGFGGKVQAILPYQGKAKLFQGGIRVYLADGTFVIRSPSFARSFASEDLAEEWAEAQQTS